MNLLHKEMIIELKRQVIGIMIKIDHDNLYTKEQTLRDLKDILSTLDDEDKHVKYLEGNHSHVSN
ncbi:hypothetical protein CJ195_21885 [Bacillus sp. UMB0899]|uniref:hypothetical protein n=1 Tax=Metabacillus sp. YM-086 TaxID=3341729 RepID=UPI000C80FF91|nr:hypothetical protein CJ195_21885 [Bacillus sp. UMB0899]